MSEMSLEKKVVIFTVGKEEYAVSIQCVKEVGPWTKPTPVPEAPPNVEGVIDLRGEVIPVIDLGRRFGTGRSRADADARIMVTEVDGRLVGYIVDEVTEVYKLEENRLAPPSPLIRQNEQDPMVVGIIKVSESRLVVLVDPTRILLEPQLAH